MGEAKQWPEYLYWTVDCQCGHEIFIEYGGIYEGGRRYGPRAVKTVTAPCERCGKVHEYTRLIPRRSSEPPPLGFP